MKKLINKHIIFILTCVILLLTGRLCFLENNEIMLIIELVCSTIVIIMTGVAKDNID